jgi:hypothetical protein
MLGVNSGYRPGSLFREEFLWAPIHSPLSGRLIGPSAAEAHTVVEHGADDARGYSTPQANEEDQGP